MTPYLLFAVDGMRYGVEATAVREIARLPELTLAEEVPPHVAGVINLRGKIEPVMDLGLRLGHAPSRYRLSDHIVMLQVDGMTMGLIVDDVSDVVTILQSAIESPAQYEEQHAQIAHFLAGNAKVGEWIIMLLDVRRLIHAPASSGAPAPAGIRTYFCPDATDEERAIFHKRANSLMRRDEDRDATNQIPLSIVELGGEYFGVELGMVREFSHLRHVTPIPCCPPHIAGNMNLRGDILTLVDIRTRLNIEAENTVAEVMVVECDDLLIGVPVDKVLEVIYLRPDEIAPLPVAHEEKYEYCKGVAHYGKGVASVLDMRKILSEGGLEVEEEP